MNYHETALLLGCPYCGAGPEVPCVSNTGRVSDWPHKARLDLVKICTRCGERPRVLRKTLVHPGGSTSGKWRLYCVECERETARTRMKEKYDSDPEFRARARERMAKWRTDNPEADAAMKRKSAQRITERRRASREASGVGERGDVS